MADIDAVAQACEGTTLRGKYRLDALIGVGGMAAVYAATHVGVGTRVAVKVLHPQKRDAGHLLEARGRATGPGARAAPTSSPSPPPSNDHPVAARLEGRAIEVDPGAHVVVFERADGARREARLVAAEGVKARRVSVTFPEALAPEPQAPPAPATSPPTPATAHLPLAPPPGPDLGAPGRRARRTWGYVAGGAGLALGAGALVFAGLGAVESSTIQGGGLATGSAISADASTGQTYNVLAWTLGGVGAAALVTGAILLLSSRDPAAPRVALGPVGSGSGFTLGADW